MSYRFRRVPVTPEMNPFQRKVGCDQGVFSGREPQHRAVVSDSKLDRVMPSATRRKGLCHMANAGDKRFFRKGHDVNNIRDSRADVEVASAPRARPRCCKSPVFSGQGERQGRNLSQGGCGYPPSVTREFVDRGNPVCYRKPVISLNLWPS